MLPAMADPTPVFDDLQQESEELDRLVARLGPREWGLATPAPGWSVAHQIAHLAWTDRSALCAVTDADGFRELVEKALAEPDAFVDRGAEEGAGLPSDVLLARWREGRAGLDTALRAAPRPRAARKAQERRASVLRSTSSGCVRASASMPPRR